MKALRVLGALVLLAHAGAASVRAGDETCHPIEVTDYSPTGIAGCTLDGATAGTASWYSGVVAAGNWCTYPFIGCGVVAVQSHATGLVITIAVGSFCDCYTGTDHERLIDLTRGQVLALGLDPDDGLFAVTVTPILVGPEPGFGISNTAGPKVAHGTWLPLLVVAPPFILGLLAAVRARNARRRAGVFRGSQVEEIVAWLE